MRRGGAGFCVGERSVSSVLSIGSKFLWGIQVRMPLDPEFRSPGESSGLEVEVCT